MTSDDHDPGNSSKSSKSCDHDPGDEHVERDQLRRLTDVFAEVRAEQLERERDEARAEVERLRARLGKLEDASRDVRDWLERQTPETHRGGVCGGCSYCVYATLLTSVLGG